MKINIKATNLDLTSSIKQYIEEKVGSLDKFVLARFQEEKDSEKFGHPSVEAFVEIARTTNHHRNGEIFRAEINMKVGGNLLRSAEENVDVRTAIDLAKEALRAELTKEKGVRDTRFKKGARILKRLESISPLAWFRKEEK